MALNFLNNGYFAGKVGIGKPVPTKPLDVIGNAQITGTLTVLTANNNIRLLDSNDNTVNFSVGVNGKFQVRDVNAGTNPFQIEKAAIDNSLYIKANGSVGIGTSTPGTINSVAFSGVGLHVKAGTLGRTITEGTSFAEFIMNHSNASANQKVKFALSQAGVLELGSMDDNGTRRTQLSILNNGNVGIGTESPSGLLHLSSTSPSIYIEDTDATNTYNITRINGAGGNLSFDTRRSSDGGFVSTDYQIVKGATGADYQRWFTIGTERMRINSLGKVGIGTTTPVEQLTVFGQVASTSSSSTVSTAGANRAIMDLTGGGARMGHFRGATAAGSGFLRLFTDSVERMRINSAGNVGIGTTSPSAKLDVVGNVVIATTGVTDNLLLTSVDTSAASAPDLVLFRNAAIADNDTLGVVEYKGKNGMVPSSSTPFLYNAIYSRMNDASNNHSSLSFHANKGNGTGAYVDAVHISAIGTNNSAAGALLINPSSDFELPAYNLDVKGTGNFTGLVSGITPVAAANFVTKAYVDGSGGGTGPFLPLAGGTMTGNTTNTPGTEVRFGNSNELGIFQSSGVSNIRVNSGYLAIRADDMRFMNQDTTEKMRITSAGNVGIGTTSPLAKLDITTSGNTAIPELNAVPGASTSAIFRNSGNTVILAAGVSNTNVAWLQGRQTTGTGSPFNIALNPLGGNVGIGTSSPVSPLVVKGTDVGATDNIAVQNSAGTKTFSVSNNGQVNINGSQKIVTSDASIELRNNATGLMSIKSASNYGITFGDNGGETMRINTLTNNVGIGTTSPTRKLDVVGVIQAQGQIFSIVASASTNLSTASGGQLSLYNSNNTDNNFSNIGGYNSNSLVTGQINFINESHTSRTGAIAFMTHNGSNMPERMRITSGGNVGIGTTNPALQSGGTGLHINAATSSELKFTNNTTGATASDGTALVSNSNNFAINNREAGFLTFGTSNLTRMVVDSAGNVGIGTTSPGAKLEISHSGANNGLLLENTLNSSNHQIALNIRENEGLIFQRWISGAFNGNLMRIGYTGAIKFDAYDGTNNTGTPTYLLGTDSSGNVIKTNSTPSPVTSQAASLYDLIPNGAFTTTYAFTSTAGTYAKVMQGDDVITANGTYTVQMFVNDHAVGGTQYSETYSGIMSWGSSTNTNDTGGGTISEIVLHRSGHAANQGMTYLRTRETTSSEGAELRLEIMCNRTYSAASNVVFKFVRLI